uniref:Uncharacterized protein n=1 Tax=Ditylenchus dipsaci TaxID=166011 RepID=A0A915EW25_9BILA
MEGRGRKPLRQMHSLVVELEDESQREPTYTIFYSEDSTNKAMQRSFTTFSSVIELAEKQRIIIQTIFFKNTGCDFSRSLLNKFKISKVDVLIDRSPFGTWVKNNEMFAIDYEWGSSFIPHYSTEDGVYPYEKSSLQYFHLDCRIPQGICFYSCLYFPHLLSNEVLGGRRKMDDTILQGDPLVVLLDQWKHDEICTIGFLKSLDVTNNERWFLFEEQEFAMRPLVLAIKDFGSELKEIFTADEIYNPNTNDILQWFFLDHPPADCPEKILEDFGDCEWLLRIGQQVPTSD